MWIFIKNPTMINSAKLFVTDITQLLPISWKTSGKQVPLRNIQICQKIFLSPWGHSHKHENHFIKSPTWTHFPIQPNGETGLETIVRHLDNSSLPPTLLRVLLQFGDSDWIIKSVMIWGIASPQTVTHIYIQSFIL